MFHMPNMSIHHLWWLIPNQNHCILHILISLHFDRIYAAYLGHQLQLKYKLQRCPCYLPLQLPMNYYILHTSMMYYLYCNRRRVCFLHYQPLLMNVFRNLYSHHQLMTIINLLYYEQLYF